MMFRTFLRVAVPLVLLIGLMAVLAAPLAQKIVSDWFISDVNLRARLVMSSLQDNLAPIIDTASSKRLKATLERIAANERVLALAWCDTQGVMTVQTARWPAGITCPTSPIPVDPTKAQEPHGRIIRNPDNTLHVASFALANEGVVAGTVLVVHDLSYIDRRSFSFQRQAMLFLLLLTIAVIAATVFLLWLTTRGLVQSLASNLRQSRATGKSLGHLKTPRELRPVMTEMRRLVRSIERQQGSSETWRAQWNAENLRKFVKSEFDNPEILIVSNREPYIHSRVGRDIRVQFPASGMVSALEPIMRACSGTWIAHGSGNADRDVVDADDHIMVPPSSPNYTLRRIWLSEEEQEGHYIGFSNEGIWPLCHLSFVRPIFRKSDWEMYVKVNQRFADATIAECKTSSPIILVQDYHFALVPAMIREKIPDAVIITFWHVPWPNAETFGICPWREEIIHGLLGSSIIGFHTNYHVSNFFAAADRYMESHIDRDESYVSVGNHRCRVAAYPISIEWPPLALSEVAPVEQCRSNIRTHLGIPQDAVLAVGVERWDYTKGIPDRMQALERLFELYPEWIGKLVFVQVASPTRGKINSYARLQDETREIVDAINKKYGTRGYKPAILIEEHMEQVDVFRYFRAADFCVVSALHDGMNLVAKEFVATRDDDDGILILSTFAGAARELMEAVIVNPYDIDGMAESFHQALTMPEAERKERMRIMRATIKDNNIYHWAARMLDDARRIRRQQRLFDQVLAIEDKGGTKDDGAV